MKGSRVVSYTVRLKPGQDLKAELFRVAQELDLKAACILSGVGSLKKLSLRLSGHKTTTEFKGDWEIVSITGTLAAQAMHVHLSASDADGKTIGGHLMDGNKIFTTCELVLLEQLDLEYHREEDPTYGYKELVVRPRP